MEERVEDVRPSHAQFSVLKLCMLRSERSSDCVSPTGIPSIGGENKMEKTRHGGSWVSHVPSVEKNVVDLAGT